MQKRDGFFVTAQRPDGTQTGQRPAVKVCFKDVHDKEWFAVDPPNFNVDAFFK